MNSYCDEDQRFNGMAEDEIAYFMAKSGRASELPWDAISALYFHFPELRRELAREYPELRDEYDDYEFTGNYPDDNTTWLY